MGVARERRRARTMGVGKPAPPVNGRTLALAGCPLARARGPSHMTDGSVTICEVPAHGESAKIAATGQAVPEPSRPRVSRGKARPRSVQVIAQLRGPITGEAGRAAAERGGAAP